MEFQSIPEESTEIQTLDDPATGVVPLSLFLSSLDRCCCCCGYTTHRRDQGALSRTLFHVCLVQHHQHILFNVAAREQALLGRDIGRCSFNNSRVQTDKEEHYLISSATHSM